MRVYFNAKLDEIRKQLDSHSESLKVNVSIQKKDDEELEKRLSLKMQELSAQKPKISDQIPMSEEIETSTEKTHSKPMNLALGGLNFSGDVDGKGVYELIQKL